MKIKTRTTVHVFSGNASANSLTIEIDATEEGDLEKEAVFLHQLLYDNLPAKTYEELARRMKEVSE